MVPNQNLENSSAWDKKLKKGLTQLTSLLNFNEIFKSFNTEVDQNMMVGTFYIMMYYSLCSMILEKL